MAPCRSASRGDSMTSEELGGRPAGPSQPRLDLDRVAELAVGSPTAGPNGTSGFDRVVDEAVIGRASATESAANTSERFHGWLSPDAIVNPFDIIEVDHLEG